MRLQSSTEVQLRERARVPVQPGVPSSAWSAEQLGTPSGGVLPGRNRGKNR